MQWHHFRFWKTVIHLKERTDDYTLHPLQPSLNPPWSSKDSNFRNSGFGLSLLPSTRFPFPSTYQEVHHLIYLIRPGISRSFVEPPSPEHRQWALAAVGFTPSINSWEIVQLIKMITTQLLPAAGLLPFVFTQSCEVKEVGESCRYVCLAVWISGIRYPEVFFFFTTLPAWRNWRREKKFWKNHTAPSKEGGGSLLTQAVWEQVWSSVSASLRALFFCFLMSLMLLLIDLKMNCGPDSLDNNTLMHSQCGVCFGCDRSGKFWEQQLVHIAL